jgi:short-subunit dehydrogenase
MSFASQVAIITGASSGIGWALAKRLALQGCKVGLLARRKEKLETLAGEITQSGGTAAVAPADVGDRAATHGAIEAIRDRLGPIELLIASAGVGKPTRVDPLNVADTEKMVRVNLLGLVYAIEAVLPDMLRRNSGHLAAISSLSAYKGLPGESGYCASKAAVNTYLEGLRIQLRGRGIRITTICPGFVLTPMTQINKFHMPWLLQADEAAKRIVKALERHRKVYNFPWQTALLMKMACSLPDWVLARTMRTYNANPPFPPENDADR